jgi:MFS transporter, AAHS family, 4-hydroxybenzoate transporter
MRIMAAVAPFDVSALIDSRPLGALQIRIIVLCTLVALLDGLDLQSIGLAAPGIAADLNIPPPWLSAVFSAALAGLALGAFGFGVLADRIGRKTVLIGATACFGIFTICTALAPSFAVLLAFRFLAGLGLGGAMPSFISLTSEYCPRRLRAVIVALLWAGFPLGGFVGGLLASWIIPAYGWHSVFWVGGVLPLIVCVVLVFALPESVGFLVASGAPPERISLLLRRAFPTEYIPTAPPFTLYEERAHGVPVVQLFAAGRAAGTVLLWISFFIALMMLVTNSAWAPTLLKREGIGIKEASFAMAMFNLGSVIATSFAGWLISRAGAAIILPVAMIGSAVSVALVGYAAPSVGTVILLQGLFGAFMGGGSSGLIALAAIYYPTAIRSTGVGWAMGMGRVGSFTGPLAVGSLVALGLSTAGIFVAIAVPALLAAATTAVVGRVKPA